MDKKKEHDFLAKLLVTFKIEAEEHIKAISSGLIELEKASASERQMEIVEAIFREAHSLKGAARAVNLTEIQSVCQSLESVFAILKRREMALSSELFDLLHKAADTLSKLLLSISPERTIVEKSLTAEVIQCLDSAMKVQGTGVRDQGPVDRDQPQPNTQPIPDLKTPIPETQPTSEPRSSTPVMAETIRISAGKLDSILLQAEEMLSVKLATNQHAIDLRDVNAMFGLWKKEWARTYPEVRRVQQSLERKGERNQGKTDSQFNKLLGFLNWNCDYVKSLEDKLTGLAKLAEHSRYSLSGMVDQLLQDMKKVCMLPFSSLLEIFPKLVRDLSPGAREGNGSGDPGGRG